ncbi:unnamed protein product, partial [Adineta ricciae]
MYSFLTVPIDIIYRILDHLDILTILLSLRNVCTRFNIVIDDYRPYVTLTDLNLCERHINGSKLQRLSCVLKNNTTITCLDLQQNELVADDAKYLSMILKENHSITTLNLLINEIDSQGMQYLADGLCHNQ